MHFYVKLSSCVEFILSCQWEIRGSPQQKTISVMINVKTPAVFSSQPNFIILWDDCQTSVKQFIAAICLSLQFGRL